VKSKVTLTNKITLYNILTCVNLSLNVLTVRLNAYLNIISDKAFRISFSWCVYASRSNALSSVHRLYINKRILHK